MYIYIHTPKHIISIFFITSLGVFQVHRCSPQELPPWVFARLRCKRLHRLLPGVRKPGVFFREKFHRFKDSCVIPGLAVWCSFVVARIAIFSDHQDDKLHFWLSYFFEIMRICHWYWEGATPKLYCRLLNFWGFTRCGMIWNPRWTMMNPNPFCFHLFLFVKFRLYNTKVEQLKPNPLKLDPACTNWELLLISTVGCLSSTVYLLGNHLQNNLTCQSLLHPGK